jgi:hypothetical protein
LRPGALFCEAEAHRAAKAAVGTGHDDDATLKIDVGQVHFRYVFPLQDFFIRLYEGHGVFEMINRQFHA